MRDHRAIALKAARTRATMKAARGVKRAPTSRREQSQAVARGMVMAALGDLDTYMAAPPVVEPDIEDIPFNFLPRGSSPPPAEPLEPAVAQDT